MALKCDELTIVGFIMAILLGHVKVCARNGISLITHLPRLPERSDLFLFHQMTKRLKGKYFTYVEELKRI